MLQLFIKSFYKRLFLPDIAEDNLKLLSEDVAMTIYGVMLAIEGCFQCNNLVEQWEKEFYRFDMLISPYTKCEDDEEFVSQTRQKLKILVSGDEYMGRLIYLLATLSPVTVTLQEKEVGILKHFQKKVSIMIYSHLMSRTDSDNLSSLNRITNIVSMMEDFNRVGRIFSGGLIRSLDDAEVDLDCIELEAF